MRTAPFGLAAVGSVMRIADTSAEIVVAAIVRIEVCIYIIISVSSIEIVLHGIVYGRLSDIGIVGIVGTSNEQSISKIRRVGHSVFFVHKRLADHDIQFFGRSHRHTAAIHFGKVVAIDRSIVKVGLLLALVAHSTGGNPVDIADKHQEHGSIASLLAHRIMSVHPRLDVGGSCRRRVHIIHIKIKTLLRLPFQPRLQLSCKILVRHNQHLHRRMVKVGIGIENILVDK